MPIEDLNFYPAFKVDYLHILRRLRPLYLGEGGECFSYIQSSPLGTPFLSLLTYQVRLQDRHFFPLEYTQNIFSDFCQKFWSTPRFFSALCRKFRKFLIFLTKIRKKSGFFSGKFQYFNKNLKKSGGTPKIFEKKSEKQILGVPKSEKDDNSRGALGTSEIKKTAIQEAHFACS